MKRALLVLAPAVVLAGAIVTGVGLAMRSADPPATEAVVSCASIPAGPAVRDCYKGLLEPLRNDRAALFARAAALLADPVHAAAFAGECHELFHELGKASEQQNPGAALSGVPEDWCVNGYQHGVLEVRLADVADADLATAGPAVCAGEDPAVCRHLLGHVVMRRGLESGTTAEAETFAAAVCGASAEYPSVDDARNAFRCLDGAYMEWVLWSLRVSTTTSEPLEHCRRLGERYRIVQSACLSQIGPVLYDAVASPYEALRACNTLDEAAADICVGSVTNAVASFSGDVRRDAATLCTPATLSCIAGFARSYAATVGDAVIRPFCEELYRADVEACVRHASGPLPFDY